MDHPRIDTQKRFQSSSKFLNKYIHSVTFQIYLPTLREVRDCEVE